MVGYRRFEGLEAAKLLAELYRSARLFVNFFQPSFKLIAKQRDGARARKTYSAPTTPHQRLAADARTPDAVRAQLQEIYAALDPVALLRDIRGAPRGACGYPAYRQSCWGIAIDCSLSGKSTNRLEGRSYATDGSANRESEERSAPSRPAHQGNARFAKMV
ncbi:hypothetical protein SAMN05216337_105140 [Bradyrhizobium brasilense]|uniref:Uncharacterized protein n=1 Tax=Bradyrhizobium brasilense TaxID=1419277 RepID=A0A1G7K5U6_9BRAD|nr:hypothetical protein SAMN05216337_105140 [Bradyrhizobium brasilense]